MRRLLLFARRPRAGKVKTRLAATWDQTRVLALYRAMLTDALALVRDATTDYRVELWWDGPTRESDLTGLELGHVVSREQRGADLGERLAFAFEDEQAPAVVIGTDSPTLLREKIDLAFDSLDAAHPLVLAPSSDGGFVLLGLWRPVPRFFEGIPWGGDRVCSQTLERARACSLEATLLPEGYDIDENADLERLRRDLEQPHIAAHAPATLRALDFLS